MPWGPKMARAGKGRSWQNCTATVAETPLPQPELFELSFDEGPGWVRPDRLAGVRPQEQVQRHTVEQIVDAVTVLPTLDAPVPLMVEQPVDVFQFFDALLPVAEQVIDVPKIIFEDMPGEPLFATRSWWNSWWKCQRSSFSSSRPLTFEFLVVVGDSQIFKVFFRDRVQQRRLSCRTLIFQFPVEVFKVFAQDKVAASSSSHSPAGVLEDANEPFERVCRTFP